ncbi:hypothetical protein QP270_26555, partial [Escherichia coli]|nr:hypothetical protein [Escherichia coli]
MGGIMAAMIGTAYAETLSGLAIHIAGINLADQLQRIYGDRYPEKLGSEALKIILENSPTAHPDQF